MNEIIARMLRRQLRGTHIKLGPHVKLRKQRADFLRQTQTDAIEIAALRRQHQKAGTVPEFRHNNFHGFNPVKGCVLCEAK